MASIDETSKKRLTDALNKLVAFSGSPNDKQAWSEARAALGDLGEVSGRLLAKNEREDIAFSSSLSQLDEHLESLKFSARDREAKGEFDLSLGDVEYRIKRLFGVAVR